jgi:SAM-dependent methyltransferase
VAAVAGEEHWDDRYRTVGPTAVSWYQARPDVSLDLLAAAGVGPADSVLDVGGGASTLVDHLLAAGHTDVAVLDVSSVALEDARARLGDPPGVTWIHADLLTWTPPRRWAIWHDRAVLHFLVDDADRARYVVLLRRTLEPGGTFVIGTFAEDGPTHCSGLPVRRYSHDDLGALLGDVEVVARRREVHRTPGDADQPFTWLAGRLGPQR